MKVETFTPANAMRPIGPYSHIAKAGPFIAVSATAGVDPRTNELAGPDVDAQTRQIIRTFRVMLESVGSRLEQVMHVIVYLKRIEDFDAMNRAYAEEFGAHRPARSVVAVAGLPKPGALLTMSLTAIADPEDPGDG
jgi:2-iminobutanoate/2-iminopropanoate deaminase